jgi:hypothetical protein
MANATDVRYTAAEALGRIADPASLEAMRRMADAYPEVSTRRALLNACRRDQSSARSIRVPSRNVSGSGSSYDGTFRSS